MSSERLRNPTEVILAGSVGDGPIVHADIVIFDADGKAVVAGASDSAANYEIAVPPLTLFPLKVTATGGTDLVSGEPADFELVAAVVDIDTSQVNISPFTTLVSRGAECRGGGLNRVNIENLWDVVYAQLAMGFDRSLMANQMNDPLTPDNAAAVVYANEGLGEAIRRTHRALTVTSAAADMDEIVGRIACDLAGGALDGESSGSDMRTTGTFTAAAAGVQLEMLTHRLRVNDQDAMVALNESLATILPDAVGLRVQDVPITEAFIEQTTTLVEIMGDTLGGETWDRYAMLLTTAEPGNVAGLMDEAFSAADQQSVVGAIDHVALGDFSLLTLQMESASKRRNARSPLVAFSATPTSVAPGSTSLLSWASTGASHCRGQEGDGGWSSVDALDGTYRTDPLTQSTGFVLRCVGPGGAITKTVMVAVVAPETELEHLPPEVALSVDDSSIVVGGSVALSWASAHADTCSASGGWSGQRSASGSETAGPLSTDTHFALVCQGPGGNATAQVTVQVSAVPSEPEGPVPTDPPLAAAVTLTAHPSAVGLDGTTQLTWGSSNVTSCSAFGGWSGVRATNGSTSVGPLSSDTTFSLNCSGPNGSAMTMRSVTVRVANLAWEAPDRTVDGSPLTNLAGFRIHYGPQSRSYTHTIDIDRHDLRDHVLELAPGQWYFAMTAYTDDGEESTWSNEVSKVVH